MTNKRFKFRYLIALAFLAFPFLIPSVQAAYECNIDYLALPSDLEPVLDSSGNPGDFEDCCYPSSLEPFGGISCRPEGTFLQQIGGVVTCAEPSALNIKALSQKGLDRKYFNCFTGATPSTCRAGYCPKVGTGECITDNGNTCPASKNRVNQCPGACGSCNQDSVYCPVPADGPKDPGFDLVGGSNPPAEACQLKKYGPTPTESCASQGKDVANYCTGACTGCSAGMTESGRSQGACIPFAQRFIEIFEDGLTWLGGYDYDPNGDGIADDFNNDGFVEEHAYDYSDTGPAGLKDTFVKSDMAETLNWNSPFLPKQIRWLLSNYNLCTVNSDCSAGQECSQGGICSTPTGGIGTNCSNDSDCDIIGGLECNVTNSKCSVPGGSNYFTCSSDAECKAHDTNMLCSSDNFCYTRSVDQTTCANNSFCDLVEGYVCNVTSGLCEDETPEVNLTAKFVGLTHGGSGYDGNQGGYKNVDGLCSSSSTGYEGSHVCTSKELINSYVVATGSDPIDNENAVAAWINVAGPGNTSPAVNDCKGWTDAYTKHPITKKRSFFGTTWSFSQESSAIATCDRELSFACCK